MTKFIFWQNMPTHLQSYWIRALAEQPGISVRVVLESAIPEWRKQSGWELPDYGSASVQVGVNPQLAEKIITEEGTDAVHIFSGVGAYPKIHRAFLACIRKEHRVGFMAEMPGDYGSRLRKNSNRAIGVLEFARVLSWKIKCLRFGQHIQFVLGVGEGAPIWFRKIGFAPEKVFEFAYFPPGFLPGETLNVGMWSPAATRLLCIGRLVQIKGIDRLLSALSQINSVDWELLLVGAGPDEAKLKALAKKLQLANRVIFYGALPYPEAMSVLGGADVLLLPSRIDGYGAVVNEALSRGVPVICSDQCGARQVVKMDPSFGSVFTDFESLRTALEKWISKGRKSEEATRTVQASAECTAPLSGANYFQEIMSNIYENGLRPEAPWRRNGQQYSEEIGTHAASH